MSERNIFAALRSWLARRAFSFRKIFWITGTLAFFLSPMIDNLTTALILSAVVIAVGGDDRRFVSMACVNIVVAANAGGAFSPFGDITTLMVWQRGVVEFWTFFALFVPAAVNYLVPAVVMSLFVPDRRATPTGEDARIKRGGVVILLLFGCTVATTVVFHNSLALPPFLGMMTGLAYLKLFGYYLQRTHVPTVAEQADYGEVGDIGAFDSFREMSRVEWDTLMFFFGIVMCVGGLGFIGYLEHFSTFVYGELGATTANVLIGMLSAIIDNIPIMVAVLEMNPPMDLSQWLLVTMTAGVGGSLLSVGSAAGVALMGQARGRYTFFSHLRWSPIILVGYLLAIWAHLLINARFAGIAAGG
jgi:Na+/H+ antiporter NhaD/arsenite permease-like protein